MNKFNHSLRRNTLTLLLGSVLPTSVFAQSLNLTNPTISAVLDGYYQSSDRLMTERTEGFGLGETELAFSASIDDMFYGKLTTVFETHDGESEVNVEEAFIQTLALPNGFTIRAGRFLSDIGYLNNQHLHTDAFVGRPSAYRAFLGGHYFDDGLRLSYLAPTDIYWNLGLEAFKGESLRADDEHGEREFDATGIFTAFTKFGGDIGFEGSWQLGLTYMHNQNGALTPDEHDEELAEDGHEEDAYKGHAHSARYTGEHTFAADVVYKWAPNGNYKYQHLALSAEYFRVNDFLPTQSHDNEHEDEHKTSSKDYHQGWYVSSVYQFSPHWSAGLRYGKLDTQQLHQGHFEQQKLKETELSIAWHNSHFSTVRMQFSHQNSSGFDDAQDDNVFTIQYVMAMGAHNAHQY